MRWRRVFWLAALLCAGGSAAGSGTGVGIPAEIARNYGAARHFKALAASESVAGDPLLVRYAFNFDTASAALQAALAYCEEARRQTPEPERWTKCRPVWIGPYLVDGADESHLEAVLDRYLEASIAALTQRLEQTDDRATRTTLETILHKSGRYAASEALLTDLAASGEALARNALAYHWAERDINLEQALSYADSAVASDPGSASFQDTRSLVLYRLGRLEESLAAAERAVALDPHPIILDHYGDILWAGGRCADAARAWRGAMADSEDVLLRQRVARKLVGGPEGPPVFD